MKIKPNIGNADRIIRAIVGVALILVAFLVLDAAHANYGGIILAIFGMMVVVTAITRYCILYPLFHYSTIKKS